MIRSVLLIDNRDSFSFNLVDSFRRLGCRVRAMRNAIAADEALAIAEAEQALIVLSPGPGTPERAGCCVELVTIAKGRVPLLGVCLGHQAIVLEAGGTVCRAPEPVHGKACRISHDATGPFTRLPNPMRVARYHSLGTRGIPPRFTVHAECDGLAMAISDPEAKQVGLQFHPESILTPDGQRLLRNIVGLPPQ